MHWLLLVFLAFPTFAEQPKKSQKTASKPTVQKSTGHLTLPQFIDKALKGGRETGFRPAIGRLLGLPEKIICRGYDVPPEEATDKLDRTLDVVIGESSASSAPVAWKVTLQTNYQWHDNSESYYYLASPEGILEKAVVVTGKVDPSGNAIKGSGHSVEKDVDSPEIKDRFRHELDFWLKNAYRKKAKPEKKAPPATGKITP